MKLSIGFSPCPNDTFIFDAMVHQKTDTGGIEFDVLLEDVETLNRWALEGKLDITKLSFPAFFQSSHHYQLLDAGSALGNGVGPLLVAKKETTATTDLVNQSSIALPGAHTTANLLFGFAFPDANNRQYMHFAAIEDAVLTGKTDMGVIIHENRFTYSQKGLNRLLDLGAYWEEKTQMPIPLGGIAIRRSLDKGIQFRVQELIKKSLAHAQQLYPEIPDFVREHAQEMDEQVMRQHIELYVNAYSNSLGNTGRSAIKALQDCFTLQQSAVISSETGPLFID